jgi:aerobic carbon-monoxide dehydrogenase medium subunit
MATFEYASPQSLEQAVALLSDRPEAQLLAGGQKVLLGRSRDRSKSRVLIDLAQIASLRGIREQADGVWIGAMTTLNEIASSELIQSHFPRLGETAGTVGDAQLRNRATIGGNLAEGNPEYDFAALLVALNASIELTGPRGLRKSSAEELLTGRIQEVLAGHELLVAIVIPTFAANTRMAYVRVKHPARLTAICGVAAVLTAEHGRVVKARIAVTGATERPSRLKAVEQALLDGTANGDQGASEAAISGDGIAFQGDLYASAEYRRHLARVLTGRAIRQALLPTTL